MIVNRQFLVLVSIINEQSSALFHFVLIVLFITIFWCCRAIKLEIFSKNQANNAIFLL
jgi:uncharacterized membrane protein YwzB